MFTTSCYEFSELTEMALDEVHGGSVKFNAPSPNYAFTCGLINGFLAAGGHGVSGDSVYGPLTFF